MSLSSRQNYEHPHIPVGFKHLRSNYSNGFLIRGIKSKNEYVWVPVETLAYNGTLNGTDFAKQFGRRNFKKDIVDSSKCWEDIPEDHLLSIQKYGGFYISRFPISKNVVTGRPQSRKGGKPISCDFLTAFQLSQFVEQEEFAQSHMTYGAEWDTMIEWFFESSTISYEKGGYFYVSKDKKKSPLLNNIAGITCPAIKLTQERYLKEDRIARGGYDTIAYRRLIHPKRRPMVNSSFYVALTII